MLSVTSATSLPTNPSAAHPAAAPSDERPDRAAASVPPSLSVWRIPVKDADHDPRLPHASDLSWTQKDRFVRLNGKRRNNRKAEAAALGGTAAGFGTLCAGLGVATLGAAVPLMLGGLALAGGSLVGLGSNNSRLKRPHPEGLRKHLLSDFDGVITPTQSEQIVHDLKKRGVYAAGRTRKLSDVDTVAWAVKNSAAVPEEKRELVASLVRFHAEDARWRDNLATCLQVSKAELKGFDRQDPRSLDSGRAARREALQGLRGDLEALRDAAP
ncbi:MAG TPA: hypothetical protein VFH51_00270, partial [Myxococcota bacterium]|nr:hypothetical protein [Myxococcota bacterium]